MIFSKFHVKVLMQSKISNEINDRSQSEAGRSSYLDAAYTRQTDCSKNALRNFSAIICLLSCASIQMYH